MKLRIGVYAKFSGVTEIELSDDEIEKRGGINAWAERYADDLAGGVLEQAPELDVEIDDLDRWDEATGKWVVVDADQ